MFLLLPMEEILDLYGIYYMHNYNKCMRLQGAREGKWNSMTLQFAICLPIFIFKDRPLKSSRLQLKKNSEGFYPNRLVFTDDITDLVTSAANRWAVTG